MWQLDTLSFNMFQPINFPFFPIRAGFYTYALDALKPSLGRSTSVLLDKTCLWPSFRWQSRQWALSYVRPEPKQTGLNWLNQVDSSKPLKWPYWSVFLFLTPLTSLSNAGSCALKLRGLIRWQNDCCVTSNHIDCLPQVCTEVALPHWLYVRLCKFVPVVLSHFCLFRAD